MESPAYTVLFDMDGTLSDPVVGFCRCIQYSMDRMGRPTPPESELHKFIGPPTAIAFASLLGTDDLAQINEAVRIYRERLEEVGYKENTAYPGVRDLLRQLKEEGYGLGVVTARATVYANLILGELGLQDGFEFVLGTDPNHLNTPKTQTMGTAMARLGGHACMVGDRSHDIEAAHAHGLWAIGVTYGYGSEEELKTAGADVICHTAEEVLAAVRAWKLSASAGEAPCGVAQ